MSIQNLEEQGMEFERTEFKEQDGAQNWKQRGAELETARCGI